MGLFEELRKEVCDASQEKSLTLSNDSITATVYGLLTDHNQGYDPDTGMPVNARNAHASIHIDVLTENGFTANINNHYITDNETGRKYKITQLLANTTTGLIPCMLKDVK